MFDPLTSLVVIAGTLALAVALLWPGTGLAWRWRRGLVASDRVEVEDALKHIWDGEYRQRPATLESLAGALGLSGRAAAELVDRLGRLDLLDHEDGTLRLTADGRREALRVIRIHRLWERYLADETGLDAREWHAHAERREHGTSAQQAEALAATLGHPRYDPHGDPIPMPSGEVPPHQGIPLTQLAADQVAEIVHLEDEPDAVFAQIVAAGLMPGMRVRVLERSPKRLRIEAEADEVVLAPVVAANVTVLPIEQPAADAGTMTRLSAIAAGRGGRGRVAGGDVSRRPAPAAARPRRRPRHPRHQRAARAVGRSDRLPDSRRADRAAPRSGAPHLRPQGERGDRMSHPSPEACATCPAHHLTNLKKLGVDMAGHDYVVALAGNPNTGKSTVFNALTGLRQHTGNWPGKTVTRAEGAFATGEHRYKLVDLPGTYSLLSASLDEEVARDFILFGQPDVTVIVVDATRLERNLNLVLQVLEITDRAVVCLNLMDEARRHGLDVDPRRLARDLGVRVVPTAARQGEGLPELMQAIAEVANGAAVGTPHRVGERSAGLQRAVTRVSEAVLGLYPTLPNAAWVALRLLDGDEHIQSALRSGELGELHQQTDPAAVASATPPDPQAADARSSSWRRSCAGRSAPTSISR